MASPWLFKKLLCRDGSQGESEDVQVQRTYRIRDEAGIENEWGAWP